MNEYTDHQQEHEGAPEGWQSQQGNYNQPGGNPQNQPPQNWQQPDQNWQNNPYNQYNSYNQPPQKQKNGMALASMLLGIFSLINCCIPFFQFPLAALAIVLAIISRKGRPFHGFAIAGLVIGILSVVISIGMTFYWGLVLEMMQDPEFMEMYDEIMRMYMNPPQQ